MWIAAEVAAADPLVVSASVAVVVSRLVWVFAFWLRLRARARRDTARYRYVTAALGAIPAARLEVVHPDGSLLRVTGTTSEGADHAAR